jgi:hypothetical protein
MANGWGARSSWKMCVERWVLGSERGWGDRDVGRDGCRLRPHFVKAVVRVHAYPDGTASVFLGPHRLATFSAAGDLLASPTASSLAACSSASRDGLETPALAGRSARRPPLTRPARTANRQARVGTEGLQVEQRNRPGGWSPSHRPWHDRADGPSTPSGPADSLTRRRQITSYKNTTTSRATDTIA